MKAWHYRPLPLMNVEGTGFAGELVDQLQIESCSWKFSDYVVEVTGEASAGVTPTETTTDNWELRLKTED